MARIGRNDPCPCGSGRKHKKCCGGGRPRPAARTLGLGASFTRILNRGAEVAAAHDTAVNELLTAAGCVPGHVQQDPEASESALRFAGVASCLIDRPAAQRIHARVEAALPAHERALHRALRVARFDAWRLEGPTGGWRLAPVAPGTTGADGLIEPYLHVRAGEPTPDTWAGWLVDLPAGRVFVGLAPLTPAGRDRLRADRSRVPSMRPAAADVLAAVLDPEGEMVMGAFPIAGLLRAARSRLEGDVATIVARTTEWCDRGVTIEIRVGERIVTVSHPRIMFAAAATPEDVALAVAALGRVRDAVGLQLIGPLVGFVGHERAREAVRAVVPVARLLEHLRVGPGGAVESCDDEQLAERPAALLLLDRPPKGGRPTIREALAGVDREAAGAAWRTYRAESRWLATSRPGVAPSYEAVLYALRHLFDPRASDGVPLEALGLTSAAFNRLTRAMGATRPTIDALPVQAEMLLEQPGFGRGTLARLEEALFDHATHWRARRAGIDARRVGRPTAKRLDEARLDELAALLTAP